MSGHSQPVYLPSGSTAGAFRNATMSLNRGHVHEENPGSAGDQQVPDHNMIEPSLANMQPQEAYPIGMSQAEERVFELQLQAAAAVANDDGPPSTDQMAHDQAVRQRRLGRACDACSKRKVKCGDEIPCKNCIDLGVPCTFIRPAKRRGPANRVAEELKRARYELSDLNPTSNTPSSAPASSYLNLDSIAPFETVHRLVYDFFTYVYPVLPFPHEHLVMEKLRKRDDTHDRSFCVLISSMLTALSALFPRIVQTALGQLEHDGYVISIEAFTSRCTLVYEQSRSPLISEKNVDDATTAFFVGLVCYVRRQYAQVEIYLAEALAVVRFLGVERDGVLADGSPADFVTKELCRRIYWAVEILARLLQQNGSILDIMPPRRASQLPHLPLATDDYYIYVDRIQEQPQGQLSSLEGFNLLASIYALHQSLVQFDLSEDHDSEAVAIKLALFNLDAILPGGHPELASLPNSSVFSVEEAIPSQQARMHTRWELQKIILRSTLISTRFYLASRLAGIGTESDKYLQDVHDKCLHEFAELVNHTTRTSVEAVAKLILPQLHVVVDALQKKSSGINQQSREIVTSVARFMEMSESL